jgi:hypothetical protein
VSIGSALVRGQRAAEAAMTLTLTAYSPNGYTTDGDGLQVRAFANEGATRGKVQGSSSSVADAGTQYVTIGGVSRAVMRAGVHLPVASDLPVAGDQGIGWEYAVTALGPDDDPSLLGRRFLVVGVPAESFATARRLDVVEV